jgi:hypothetical protein
MNWKKRKRLTRLIHKHELDGHSDYKEWVKECCIVSGYYGKPRYQLLKEWKDLNDDEFIEKLAAALKKYDKNKNMSKMMKELIDGGWFDAIEETVDKVREETAKVKPLPPHLRSIGEFTNFMSNLPPYVQPSEEEWNEGMKRAEEFHRALNGEEK